MSTDNPKRVTIELEGNVLTFDSTGPCATVSRTGSHPFNQAYEDTDEAYQFFGRLVGHAYLRTVQDKPAMPDDVEAFLVGVEARIDDGAFDFNTYDADALRLAAIVRELHGRLAKLEAACAEIVKLRDECAVDPTTIVNRSLQKLDAEIVHMSVLLP